MYLYAISSEDLHTHRHTQHTHTHISGGEYVILLFIFFIFFLFFFVFGVNFLLFVVLHGMFKCMCNTTPLEIDYKRPCTKGVFYSNILNSPPPPSVLISVYIYFKFVGILHSLGDPGGTFWNYLF